MAIWAGAGTGVNGPTGQVAAGSAALNDSTALNNGWYVFVACGSGILLSGTRIGPLVGAILTLAVIYQLNLLVEGK